MERNKKKAKRYCAVFNCLNTDRDPNLTFYKLPKEVERRQKWLSMIGREDLLSNVNLKYSSYLICSSHFEKSSIKIVRNLKEDAIPTVLLPNQSQDETSQTNLNKLTTPVHRTLKMVNTTCAVRGCSSSSRVNKELKFHPFPRMEDSSSTAVHSESTADRQQEAASLNGTVTTAESLHTEWPAMDPELLTSGLRTDKCDTGDSLGKMEPETVYLTSNVEPECLACRSCLETEGKLRNIHEMRLAEPFIQVTGTQVFESDGLPQQLCVYCAELVRKLAQFQARARTAQGLMVRALLQRHAITTRFIKTVDRAAFKLLLPYRAEVFSDIDLTEENSDVIKTEVNKLESDHLSLEYEAIDYNDDNLSGNTNSESASFEHFPIKTETIECDIYENDVTIFDIPLETQNSIEQTESIQTIGSRVKSKNIKVGATNKKTTKNRVNKVKVIESDENKQTVNKKRAERSDSDMKDIGKSSRKGKKLNQPKWYEVDEQIREFESDYNVKVMLLDMEQQMSDYEARKLSRNYVRSPLKCDICYRGFEQQCGYDNHMKMHDKSRGAIVCNICHMVFPHPSTLKKHSVQHLLRIKCNDCQFTTCLATRAIEHFKAHQGHRYKCEHCGKGYRLRSTYLTHVRYLHPAAGQTCPECGEVFNGRMGLMVHSKVHQASDQTKSNTEGSRCDNCHVLFRSEEALKFHVMDTCKPDTWACVECGKNLESEASLKEHSESHKQTYQCTECVLTFSNESSRAVHHERIHLQVRRKDPRCSLRAALRRASGPAAGAALRRHAPRGGRASPVRRRTRHAVSVCEYCGRKFPSVAAMEYHRRTHTGEKPFECEVCHKRFTTGFFLKTHRRSHTGERPYQCQLCPKAFASPSVLNMHQRVHTGEKPHACPVCAKTFTQSNSMKLHVHTVHMKLPAPYKSRRRRQQAEARLQQAGSAKLA